LKNELIMNKEIDGIAHPEVVHIAAANPHCLHAHADIVRA